MELARYFLLDEIDDEDSPRHILNQLNQGEGRHSMARFICHGQRGEIRKRYLKRVNKINWDLLA